MRAKKFKDWINKYDDDDEVIVGASPATFDMIVKEGCSLAIYEKPGSELDLFIDKECPNPKL